MRVLPCVVCGDPAGKSRRKDGLTSRYRVKRFGVSGLACYACYNRLSQRFRDREFRRKMRDQYVNSTWQQVAAQIRVDAMNEVMSCCEKRGTPKDVAEMKEFMKSIVA